MNAPTAPQPADAHLWNLARARAHFKVQLVRFLLINLLLWAIWFFTDAPHHYAGHHFHGELPWPAWVTLFWGLGVAIKGLTCYGFWGKESWSEREYQQLLREREAGRR